MPNLTPKNIEFLSYMAVLPDRTCSVLSLHARFSEEVAEYEIDQLYSKHLIETADYAPYDGFTINHPVSYYVTMDGVAALADHLLASDCQRKQNANEQEKSRADALRDEEKQKKSFRHNLLVAIISSLITLSVEHCVEIMDFIIESFNRLVSLLH